MTQTLSVNVRNDSHAENAGFNISSRYGPLFRAQDYQNAFCCFALRAGNSRKRKAAVPKGNFQNLNPVQRGV